MLTTQQWRILTAIAKEDAVVKITSAEFLQKYKIGSATNSKRTVDSLINKEIVIENIGLRETSYSIYNGSSAAGFKRHTNPITLPKHNT